MHKWLLLHAVNPTQAERSVLLSSLKRQAFLMRCACKMPWGEGMQGTAVVTCCLRLILHQQGWESPGCCCAAVADKVSGCVCIACILGPNHAPLFVVVPWATLVSAVVLCTPIRHLHLHASPREPLLITTQSSTQGALLLLLSPFMHISAVETAWKGPSRFECTCIWDRGTSTCCSCSLFVGKPSATHIVGVGGKGFSLV